MLLVTLVVVFAVVSFQDAAPKTDTAPSPGPPEGTAGPPGGAGGPAPVSPDCPAPTLTVATAAELTAALAAPQPGAVILLADGVYVGNFVGSGTGTAEQPITLCGGKGAVLDGGGPEDGYVLHLDRASYWTVQGFTVRNGQKGVMLDETTNSLIQGLAVQGTGDEGIHLRRFSSDNRVVGNTVTGAGLRKPKFGEGIYIGTAESNWCDIAACEPDKSDRNEIRGNIISGTTAESVDIKEGTSDGVLIGNNFEGSSIQEADSWVDVKGKGWRIERNTGKNSPLDGFQTHEILDGWGTGNVFRENTAEVNGPGFGYSLKPVRDNVVECSNTASRAEQGLSNLPCTN
ncbi:hypothetical protein DBR22_11155 [Arthrobacter sp. HMWF013]|nr:hypothetical protein DBR22_11155 [Arthrobacter sp. HMWF013]